MILLKALQFSKAMFFTVLSNVQYYRHVKWGMCAFHCTCNNSSTFTLTLKYQVRPAELRSTGLFLLFIYFNSAVIEQQGVNKMWCDQYKWAWLAFPGRNGHECMLSLLGQTEGGVANLLLQLPSSIHSHSYGALWVKVFFPRDTTAVKDEAGFEPQTFWSLNSNGYGDLKCKNK